MQKESFDQGRFVTNKIARCQQKKQQHPFAVQAMFGKVGAVLMQVITIVLVIRPLWPIPYSISQQLLITGIQVIASLYGLTVTGYIFFMGNQEQHAAQNHLLEDVVSSMKQRFYKYLVFSTAYLIMTLCLSVVMLLCLNEGTLPVIVLRFLFGETIVGMFSAIYMFLVTAVTMLDPKLVEKISTNAQNQLNKETQKGDYKGFMEDCQAIERLLRELSGKLLHFNGEKASVERMANMLNAHRLMDYTLWRNLAKISQSYSFAHFSKREQISVDLCVLAKECRRQLESRAEKMK